MKKFISIILFIALLFSGVQNPLAAGIKTYPNSVNVSVHINKNVTLTLNGNYQLTNRQTGSKTMIPPGTTITATSNSTNVTVSYTGFSQTSTSGFDVNELAGTAQLAVFTAQTDMRRGADTSYAKVYTFQTGDSANYLGSFTNRTTGELWYNVNIGSYTGWVPAKNAKLTQGDKLSLAAVSNGLTYRGSFYLKKNGSQVEVINILDMEDYLKGVVPNEMPASWHKEALKAQAIAARSYAANMMMLTSTAASQVYRGYSYEDTRANTAIKETEGLLVKYNGKPIQTFFFSTSGGRTANVGDVWNSNQSSFPYLVSVEDKYEKSPYSNWSEAYSAATILKSFGFDSTAKLLDISLEIKGANGEVGAVTVKTSKGDKTVRGNESVIRKLFPLQSSAHYNSLYSNWFTMEVTRSQPALSVQTNSGYVPISDMKGQKVQTSNGEITLSDSKVSVQTPTGVITSESGTGEVLSVTLNGKGWGHRIGMSQYGAKAYAENGWTSTQIITHYFKGTSVSK
ncbi:SpoIID/LytB domain-containing protein [Cytobacillus firmus]|uniref:SpoIID/LytB domain-containing protein n=1 Tax=Cytobacillus TaxID=2675230 RepID=UPI00203FAB76|nr:SpoIID/LytB domain-containing protein [Cytobacillus oceanisediminis]MCM3246094.1 SpoIID/LytB domain-containing protein [Cytobacillus oceanisediminis]MCS0827775.1 SpoIID/LytB domain-containing protein [Cytobacillus firmus]